MPDAVCGRSCRFELANLPEVVQKCFGISAIKSGPEGRFGDGHDARHGHPLVVLRSPGDGVVVRLDRLHLVPPAGSGEAADDLTQDVDYSSVNSINNCSLRLSSCAGLGKQCQRLINLVQASVLQTLAIAPSGTIDPIQGGSNFHQHTAGVQEFSI